MMSANAPKLPRRAAQGALTPSRRFDCGAARRVHFMPVDHESVRDPVPALAWVLAPGPDAPALDSAEADTLDARLSAAAA